MGTYVPVRAPTGPAGPRESLVPVRLRVYVLVPYKNRDQCPRSLAHIHCPRFVARTGTKGCPLVPVPTTNRDQGFGYISLARDRALHWCSVFSRRARGGFCGALAHLQCT